MISLLIKSNKLQFSKGSGNVTIQLGKPSPPDMSKQSSFKEWNKKIECPKK